MVQKNKKGVVTFGLIILIGVGFLLMIVLGITVWSFTIVDGLFSKIDFDVGNTSFNDTYDQILRPGITSFTTTMPAIISTGVLLGMILSLMIVGYQSKKIGKLWILLDIAIIIVAEAIAATVSSGFVSFINYNPELLSIYSNNLSSGARYIINLPTIIPISGALIMLVTHLTTRKKEEQEASKF